MAIYHCSKSEVQRSKGHNAVAASSYISRSKLQLITTDNSTKEKQTISYNSTSRKGLAHSIILAPDDAPSWVYDRQELWNRAESVETRKNAETARKLIIALPKELTLQQNIELIEQFALECLVSHGMVADINIHYDSEDNPHVHIQMTTRKLIRSLENDQVVFGEKGRDWGRRKFLYYYRENVAHFINLYLEKHGALDRVSHLSHKARGIDLVPTIHEGAAHYIKDSKLRLINEQILKKNAAKIRTNPELVFDKLSINKPVFTREEIAIALSDALTIDIELGQTDKQLDGGNKQGFQQRLREISKQLVVEDLLIESLVTENVKESPNQDLTILADGSSKQDSELSSTSIVEGSNTTGSITTIDHSSHNSTGLSNVELLDQAYSTEFMRLYSNLLASDKISLINPSDLKGRTLYALTKRVKLEQRFITTVEELQHSQNHNLFIDDRAIGSMKDKLIGSIQKVGMAVQEVVNNKVGLQIELIKEQNHSLTEEQRKAIIDIVCGKDISVLEGYPGAGKTFVMREIVRQYQKAGYRVVGTAQSSSATKVLEGATGIEAKNTTLWRKEWQEARGHEFELPLRTDYYTEREYQYPDRVESNFSQQKNVSAELDNKTVFIIDEASMIELANMDYLLTQVLKSGAKVIIVGDNNQLSAIGMAGAFKKICTIADISKLTAVMRHKHPDEYTRELQSVKKRAIMTH
ncbi:MobA/MobL family protein [Candidatus Tisiphia endosymbiont of Nedyus quadrimaculatus]|uniref:MobA/MobL family protein n=1 Tax=Candidatus Tisiphia endosymbiont of Nedyus quadrimaculatus TaxID=3139332 RepID=UPI00345E3817